MIEFDWMTNILDTFSFHIFIIGKVLSYQYYSIRFGDANEIIHTCLSVFHMI